MESTPQEDGATTSPRSRFQRAIGDEASESNEVLLLVVRAAIEYGGLTSSECPRKREKLAQRR